LSSRSLPIRLPIRILQASTPRRSLVHLRSGRRFSSAHLPRAKRPQRLGGVQQRRPRRRLRRRDGNWEAQREGRERSLLLPAARAPSRARMPLTPRSARPYQRRACLERRRGDVQHAAACPVSNQPEASSASSPLPCRPAAPLSPPSLSLLLPHCQFMPSCSSTQATSSCTSGPVSRAPLRCVLFWMTVFGECSPVAVSTAHHATWMRRAKSFR